MSNPSAFEKFRKVVGIPKIELQIWILCGVLFWGKVLRGAQAASETNSVEAENQAEAYTTARHSAGISYH